MKSKQPAKSNGKSYDCAQAVEAMRYVAKLYPDLSLAAHSIYQTMHVFEADKHGFCNPVCIGVRDIAKLAHTSPRTVKGSLIALSLAGLVRVEFGQKSQRGKATKLQRVPIAELKSKTLVGESVPSQLGRALTQNGVWIDGHRMFPTWEVRKTNRLYSSKPNIQGFKKLTRMERLITGAPIGSVLVSCDFKSADPTVIKELLKLPHNFNPYEAVMQVTGWDKDKAKSETSKLDYLSDTR